MRSGECEDRGWGPFFWAAGVLGLAQGAGRQRLGRFVGHFPRRRAGNSSAGGCPKARAYLRMGAVSLRQLLVHRLNSRQTSRVVAAASWTEVVVYRFSPRYDATRGRPAFLSGSPPKRQGTAAQSKTWRTPVATGRGTPRWHPPTVHRTLPEMRPTTFSQLARVRFGVWRRSDSRRF